MTPERYFRVVGWDDFQHYKHRDPPWVKLHRRLLDNFAWSLLPDASKGHLVGVWLLASRHDNCVPYEPAWVATRIGATTAVDLEVLVAAGFIEGCTRSGKALATRKQNASKVLAPRKRNADPELEKRQSRVETETDSLFAEAWAAYPQRPGNSKAAARRAWEARVKAGADEQAMLDGARRYAAYVTAEGTDPKFIKQAATFFGPDEHYLSTYEVPSQKITVYDERGEFTPEFLRANAAAEREAARR